MSLEPDHREQTIRDRSAWAMEWYGGTVLFSGAEVGHLLRVIDELRRGPEALAGVEEGGWRRIGPDFGAWTDGEFFGRTIRLPDGTLLKLHVCLLPGPNYEWFVALPSDPDDLKRCLLEIAKHEGIDL